MEVLNEGMRPGDLEDLVLPMISVDEFESKVGDDAIVFAFFVNDRDGANDLNRFLQKSAAKTLDTEVSPAPDQRGYYLVFFEVLLNDRLPEMVMDLVAEVSPLTKIEKWSLQVRGEDDLIQLTEKSLPQVISKLQKSSSTEALSEAVLEFLTPSDLKSAVLKKNVLALEGRGHKLCGEVIAFADAFAVSSIISDSRASCDFKEVSEEIRASNMLGEGWNVSRIGRFLTIQRYDDERVLVIK